MKALPKKLLLSAIAAVLLFVVVRGRWTQKADATIFCPAIGTETVQTDTAHTYPFQTVVISGTGYVPLCGVTVQVTRPDGSIVVGDGTGTPGSDIVSTDATGSFTYLYHMGNLGGLYLVSVLGENGAALTGTWFTSAPSLSTDKNDYHPGETVTFTGAEWQPGETVSILLHEVNGPCHDRIRTATVDSSGNFSVSNFTLESHDLGVMFTATATGQSSGFVARTLFSDSTIALVQSNSARNGSATSLSATFTTTPVPGNLLIAIAGTNLESTISMSSSGWSEAINSGSNNNRPSQAIFYKVAGASEATTVTMASTASRSLGLQIFEYSGLATTSPLDGVNSNVGNNATSGATNIPPTTATDDLLNRRPHP